jgi:hypothetical protein
MANAIRRPGMSKLTESVITRNGEAYQRYLAARPPLTPKSRAESGRRAPWLERLSKKKLVARILKDSERIEFLEGALAAAVRPPDHTD